MSRVATYISKQKEHHKKQSFKDEYLELPKEFEIDFDVRYSFGLVE
jgi:putative transposase